MQVQLRAVRQAAMVARGKASRGGSGWPVLAWPLEAELAVREGVAVREEGEENAHEKRTGKKKRKIEKKRKRK